MQPSLFRTCLSASKYEKISSLLAEELCIETERLPWMFAADAYDSSKLEKGQNLSPWKQELTLPGCYSDSGGFPAAPCDTTWFPDGANKLSNITDLTVCANVWLAVVLMMCIIYILGAVSL